MFSAIKSYSPSFIGIHQEHTSYSGLPATSTSVCTDSPWSKDGGMYKTDKYARDRVMKSARLLLPYVKEGETILDVGCFTWEARKYFPRDVKYIGIDQKAYHKETRVMDLNHGFDPIACSHALCLETLEHLVDPLDTLISIRDSISDSGRIVVSLPNEATIFHRLRAIGGNLDAGSFSGEGKHLHLPNLSQATKFLAQILDIEARCYYI